MGFVRIGLLFLWCVSVATCAHLAATNSGVELRHPAVTGSAVLTVAWMMLGWCFILMRSRLARLIWSLGLVMLLAHLFFAFGWAHNWSHSAAVDHVRDVGGSGAGIVVNYVFAVVWLADVGWWWFRPTGYASRPGWMGGIIHGLLAFVVVNATVVFGPAQRRVWYVGGFALIGLIWWLAILTRPPSGTRTPAPG